MTYKFSDRIILDKKFNSVFNVAFSLFYDGLMSIVSKHLCIDILKFDDWLHVAHGDYEESGMSMKELIRENYGEKGVRLIEELM